MIKMASNMLICSNSNIDLMGQAHQETYSQPRSIDVIPWFSAYDTAGPEQKGLGNRDWIGKTIGACGKVDGKYPAAILSPKRRSH